MQKLYLILSTTITPLFYLERIAIQAIRGGIDWLQFRHKEPYTQEVLQEAKKIRTLCKQQGIPFFLNDRFDLALYLEADGVHLGQTDLPLSTVRSYLPKGTILGMTTPTAESIKQAFQEGADYASIGPIFPTSTKQKTAPLLGVEKLVEISRNAPLPLFAIGGIDEINIASVLSAPLAGVAISAAICSSLDPEKAVERILPNLRRDHVYTK